MSTWNDRAGELSREQADQTYLRIGRVVSHAALLEEWLFRLACTLDRGGGQAELAGKFGSELVKHCRRHLGPVDEPLRSDLDQLLTQITLVQGRRNVVVHSVLARPGDPAGYAYRPLPAKQREDKNNWIGDAHLTDQHLDELDAEISRLLSQLVRVRSLTDRA